jgi:hypothetical protein
MSRKVLAGVIALIVLTGAWYAFRPERLFINQKVNEGFPVAQASSAQPVTLSAGHSHSVAHETKGHASIFQLPDGRRTLRLTGFETSNGPDVRVYLVAAGDATDSETVKNAGYLEVGALKGNQGDQNYDISADVDLKKYRAVTIWCRRFGVNFGTAPLRAEAKDSTQTSTTPDSQPEAVASGRFHDVSHKGAGLATVYQLADGKRLLRFTDFETSNGPDVVVYLVGADDAQDSESVTKAGYVLLGALKGNQGDQNYEVPADVNLDKYRAVVIWCRRFNANFATAPLQRKA